MDIKSRIIELTGQKQKLIQRQQEASINIQRLAGAIAILSEQLGEIGDVIEDEYNSGEEADTSYEDAKEAMRQ